MNLTYLWLICAISLACADLLLGTAYLLILGIAAALAFLVSLFTDSFTAIFSHRCTFLQPPEEELIKADNQFRKASEY